jgi:hypothetical protein
VTTARLLIVAPIPSIDSWIVAAELPPGFMALRTVSIAPRTSRGTSTGTQRHPVKNTGDDSLVRAEPMDALPSQIERLLQAFARLDAGGRDEIVRITEIMAGAA